MEPEDREKHNAICNLQHAVSSCNELQWKQGEPKPYLLEAAIEILKAFGKDPCQKCDQTPYPYLDGEI